MPATSATASSAPDEIARLARSRGLPPETTLEQLLEHERSNAALGALSEAFDDLARLCRAARSDTVLVGVRRALSRSAAAVRLGLDWSGLV